MRSLELDYQRLISEKQKIQKDIDGCRNAGVEWSRLVDEKYPTANAADAVKCLFEVSQSGIHEKNFDPYCKLSESEFLESLGLSQSHVNTLTNEAYLQINHSHLFCIMGVSAFREHLAKLTNVHSEIERTKSLMAAIENCRSSNHELSVWLNGLSKESCHNSKVKLDEEILKVCEVLRGCAVKLPEFYAYPFEARESWETLRQMNFDMAKQSVVAETNSVATYHENGEEPPQQYEGIEPVTGNKTQLAEACCNGSRARDLDVFIRENSHHVWAKQIHRNRVALYILSKQLREKITEQLHGERSDGH